MTCSSVRRGNAVAALPPRVKLWRAARTFAGNIATSRIARQSAARTAVRGSEEADRTQQLEHSGDGDDEIGTRKRGRHHADQVGPALAPVSGRGEEKHRGKAGPQADDPTIQRGDSGGAHGPEDQRRDQEYQEGYHSFILAQQLTNKAHPEYSRASIYGPGCLAPACPLLGAPSSKNSKFFALFRTIS